MVYPPLTPRQQQAPLFHVLCFVDKAQLYQLAPFPFYLPKQRKQPALSQLPIQQSIQQSLGKQECDIDKMQGHRKHLASHSNCETPQCFIAIRSLKQYGKVKVALLHIIIAQKKSGSSVHWSIKQERQQFSWLYIVYILNLSSLGGRHARIMSGNPAQGPGANPCAGRGTDNSVPGWQTLGAYGRTPVSHWGHLNFMRTVNVYSPPALYMHVQRRQLASSTFCLSTRVGSELSSLHLTATDCSKVSRGKETWKLGSKERGSVGAWHKRGSEDFPD